MTDSQTVDVYVRLTSDEEADARQLSFRIPDGLSQAELLERDWAIDGRNALKIVEPWRDGSGEMHSLSESLVEEQRDLLKWLDGYEVHFA